MTPPQLAVLVSTYERPEHLRRVLVSIACQRRVTESIEVVVSDDGSRDETAEIVADFAASAPFRVAFTTHRHDGFHLARCRNEGVAASTAPYLLFLDGDCLIPPDHLSIHMQRRKPKTVMGGYCLRLSREASEKIDLQAVEMGTYRRLVTGHERASLRKLTWRSRWYEWIGHPTKPKLYGGNIGMWREDYQAINGYDEQFRGWGCEDDDLRLRLRAAKIVVRSILPWTHTYHLWHPVSPSVPDRWRDGANVAYLLRMDRQTRCEKGLDQHAQPCGAISHV